jgi:hypothetical protein
MTIQKKSLISTLKTAKKANVASAPLTHVEGGTAEKQVGKAMAKKLARSFGRSMAARYAKK